MNIYMNFFSRETSLEGIDFVHPINIEWLRYTQPILHYADNDGNTLDIRVSNIWNDGEFIGCTLGIQYISEWEERDTETIVLRKDGKIFSPKRKWGFKESEMPIDCLYMLLWNLYYYNSWVRVTDDRKKIHQAIGITYEGINTWSNLKQLIDHTSQSFVRALEK